MKLQMVVDALSLSIKTPVEIRGFSIDTRTIQPGDVFVAIVGEQFDGHDFVAQAIAKGAAAVIVSKPQDIPGVLQLQVPDTVKALADIAKAHRASIICPIIALTGSNGKTTVKEMIASILPAPSHATKGNLNNHLGVPLSVLGLTSEHRYAVFEMGANQPDDIRYTVDIVQPDVALINNIAPAHIAGFGSIDGVARSKGEIYTGLKKGGYAIINADDEYAGFWGNRLDGKHCIRFSANQKADVWASDIVLDDLSRARFRLHLGEACVMPIQLQVPGVHNVRNALAAASCSFAVGIEPETIQAGLQSFGGVKGRLAFKRGREHTTIIDDTYNANLRSVLTAVEVLATRPGKKMLVLGDMGELGEHGPLHHREIGAWAKEKGVDWVFTVGTLSQATSEAFGIDACHFQNKQELLAAVTPLLQPGVTVLVKGSRSSQMEDVVEQLTVS